MVPVIGPVDGDERGAEVAQSRLDGRSDVLFGHQDADWSVIRVDYLTVSDLVLYRGEGTDAEGVVADAPFWRPLREFGLGDEIAGGGIRTGK